MSEEGTQRITAAIMEVILRVTSALNLEEKEAVFTDLAGQLEDAVYDIQDELDDIADEETTEDD